MLDSIEHQFYFDSLTGLQNRRRLTEKLELRNNSFLMSHLQITRKATNFVVNVVKKVEI